MASPGTTNPKGPRNDVAIARTIYIRMSETEDELARYVDALPSALEYSSVPSLPATYFTRDGVGALVVR